MVSDDFGATWHTFGYPGFPCLTGFDYASATPYAQTSLGGLSRWTGDQWELVTGEPLWSKVAVAYGDSQELWGFNQYGVVHSADGGQTWQAKGSNGAWMIDVAVDPNDRNQIYGVFEGSGKYNVARTIGNGQWSALPIPDADGSTTATWRRISGLAIDGASNSLYMIMGNRNTTADPAGSQIWRTSNANALNLGDIKWTLVHDFGSRIIVESLATGWNPEGQGPALYAILRPDPCSPEGGACTGDSPWALHRSLDRGITWEPIKIGSIIK